MKQFLWSLTAAAMSIRTFVRSKHFRALNFMLIDVILFLHEAFHWITSYELRAGLCWSMSNIVCIFSNHKSGQNIVIQTIRRHSDTKDNKFVRLIILNRTTELGSITLERKLHPARVAVNIRYKTGISSRMKFANALHIITSITRKDRWTLIITVWEQYMYNFTSLRITWQLDTIGGGT